VRQAQFFFLLVFSDACSSSQSSIQVFVRLTHLDLSFNSLGYVGASAVAKAAAESESLVWLSLASNNIGGKDSQTLMELLFGPKSRLQSVTLSDNKLGNEGVQTLALWLSVNTALNELILENVGMTEVGLSHLLQGLGNNCFVQRLGLLRNPIPKLSASRGITEQLLGHVYRNIALVQMELPDVGPYFPERVVLPRNQNMALSRCPEMGYFSERGWTTIPMPLFAHVQLTKLDLSMSQLAGLPFSILQLVNLDYLNIANNCIEITGVPVHLRDLRSLETLRVEGNPFVDYIPERYSLSELEDIFSFFDFFCESTLTGVHIKTVVLGAARAGKSRFVKTLAQAGPELPTNTIKSKRRSRSMAETAAAADALASSGSSIGVERGTGRRMTSKSSERDLLSTSGGGGASSENAASQVSVTRVMLPLPDRSARLNVWDFCIPEVESHPMIQFYLSDGAFYVIVVNPSNSDWRESVKYWKSTIEGRVTRADVFFVVTHKDRAGSAAAHVMTEITRDFLPQGTARKPKVGGITYHGVWGVSTNVREVSVLLSKMAVVASPRVNEMGRVPVPWAVMESMLGEEEGVLSFPLVSFSRFESMALACGALDNEVPRMARYLHETGAIIHYSDIRKLSNVVILSPLWLLKVAWRLLAFGGSDGSSQGTFQVEDLPEIWPAYEFPPRSHEPIVQLLEAFEVLNPLGRVLIMPFLVPDKPPREEEWPLNRVVMGKRYARVYTFRSGAVPRTLMAQLIIRLLEMSTRAFSIWQSGVIFSVKERSYLHMVAVRLDRAKDELLMDVSTNDKSGKVLHILHSTIESVLDGWYKNLEYRTFAIGSDGERVALDELAKLSMQMRHKIGVAVSEDLAPDILMKSTYRVNMAEVDEGNFIAAGAFGSVTNARYQGKDVVVKRMLTLEHISQPEMYSSFLKECWAMSFLHHECIIEMVGISLEPLCIVIEYMNQRDLRFFLDHFALPPWPLRLKILMDVSRGMAYAHEQFPRVIHRDLKSPNVFLALSSDGTLSAKVADLGLATVLPKLIKNAVVENPTWSAPEVVAREPYSHPADVYSFGIIMWEVLTGGFPFGDLWNKTQFTMEIVTLIMKGTRPTIPSNLTGVPAGFVELMKSAWAHLEEDRPSFNQLSQGLAVITRSYVDSAIAAAGGAPAAGVAAAPQPAAVGAAAATAPAAAPAQPIVKAAALRIMHRLPRIWGGGSCVVGGSLLVTLRAESEFDVMDLRTDSVASFRHMSSTLGLRDLCLIEASPTAAWAVDGSSNEILVLETNGRSSAVACSDVRKLTSLVMVNEQIWSSGQEEGEGDAVRSCLHIWSVERMTRRLLAKVKGVLRHGLSASNFSVYFACTRSNKTKHFLWRMRLSDKKCSKLRLPSAACCLIDVQHRAEVWAVCPESNCVVRSSYDLKEQGRLQVGPNIFRSGVYVDRLRCVASIGSASMCLWNCESMVPYSIRNMANDMGGMNTARPVVRDIAPHLVYLKVFGEVVAVTAEQMQLVMLESAQAGPFVPEPRRVEEERKVSRVEKRQKATRTMLQQFEVRRERSLSNSDSGEAAEKKYAFAATRYSDVSHPMGLEDLLKMSSSEDLFSDDALNKHSASREIRGKMTLSRDRSTSDSSGEAAVASAGVVSNNPSRSRAGSASLVPVGPAGKVRSNSSVNTADMSPQARRRRASFHERDRMRSKTPPSKSPLERSPRGRSSPLEKSPRARGSPLERSPRGVISPRARLVLDRSPRGGNVNSPRRSTSASVLVSTPRGGGGPVEPSASAVASVAASVAAGAPVATVNKRASLLRRHDSVVVERLALQGNSGLKLFAYEKKSVEMSPLEAQLSAGSIPKVGTPPEDSGRVGSPSEPTPGVYEGLVSSSDSEAASSPGHKNLRSSGSGVLSSFDDVQLVNERNPSGSDLRVHMKKPSATAGPIGLVGLVDDNTMAKLYPDDGKMMRRSTKLQKRLQRAEEPVLRRSSYSSVNIGGMAMKVEASPAIVPKLKMPVAPPPEPKRKGSGKGRLSPKFSFLKGKKKSVDVADTPSSLSPKTPPGPVIPRTPPGILSPGGRVLLSPAMDETGSVPVSSGRRSRSNTTYSTLERPQVAGRGHNRARSVGGANQVEDPEVKEMRDLLTARLGNGVQAMKGRSGSVSGPTTVRGVPKSHQRMRRVLQGDMGAMSPPSSDEHRDSESMLSPLRSPVWSPAQSPKGEAPINLIDAEKLESMYARRTKASSTPPAERHQGGTSSSSEASEQAASSPTASSGSGGSVPTAIPQQKATRKLPRALSKITELFSKSRESSASGSPSSSNNTPPVEGHMELHTRIERRGSFAGPHLSEALLRVSKQAEEHRRMSDAPVPDLLASGESRRSLGNEYDEVNDSSGSSSTTRREDKK
jgi:hypothetical protein